MRRSLLLLLSCILGSACAPVSVSHYQSAKPLPQGDLAVGGGFHFPRDGAQGTDEDNADGDEITAHNAVPILLNSVDFEAHFSPVKNFQVGGQVFPTGAELSARYVLLDAEPVFGAAGVAAGLFYGSGNEPLRDNPVHNRWRGQYVEVPVTFSWYPLKWLGVYGGPLASYWHVTRDTVERDKDTNQVLSSFHRDVTFAQVGGFLGVTLGTVVQFSAGVTFYAEDNEYPIDNFVSGPVFAYPWFGVIANPRISQWRKPRVAPMPPPEEVEPVPPPPSPPEPGADASSEGTSDETVPTEGTPTETAPDEPTPDATPPPDSGGTEQPVPSPTEGASEP